MENSKSGIRTEGWDWVGAFRSCHCCEEQDVSIYVFPVPSVLQDCSILGRRGFMSSFGLGRGSLNWYLMAKCAAEWMFLLKCLLALKTGASKQTKHFLKNRQHFTLSSTASWLCRLTRLSGGQHGDDLTCWHGPLIGCVRIINHFDN